MEYAVPLSTQPDRVCRCPNKVTKAHCCWECGTFTRLLDTPPHPGTCDAPTETTEP